MNSPSLTIRAATTKDLPAIIDLRAEAEHWLREQGIRQWTPDYDDYAREVLRDWVHSGAAWVVEDKNVVVATVSLNGTADMDFWGWLPEEQRADALYLGKMIVSRSRAGQGIGDAVLNWASERAQAAGVRWLRIDVRRDNMELQNYYLARLFNHLRTFKPAQRRTESGALFQRMAGTTMPVPIKLTEVYRHGVAGT